MFIDLRFVTPFPDTRCRVGASHTRRRGICLFESSPSHTRCGRGRDELHEGGRYGPNNCIEKQLVLSEQRIWSELGEGDATSGKVIIIEGHDFDQSTKLSKSYLNKRDVNWSHHAR